MSRALLLGLVMAALIVGGGQARAEAAESKAKGPLVYGWFPAKHGSWKTQGIRWDLLTHICYRDVVLRADGTLKEALAGQDEALREFVEKAHSHGVKVTVVAWANNRADSDGYLANAPQQAAENLLAYVRRHNLDGVNIDDEMMREQNLVAGKPNRELVTNFFRILHRTFKTVNPDYHITYDAHGVISPADQFATTWPDYAAIAEVVDAIIPMGYAINPPSIGWSGNSEPVGGGGKWPNTTQRDLKTMINDFQKASKADASKLLLGVSLAFGGYEWRTRTDQPLSATVGKGVRRSLEECEAAALTHGRRWEEQQASPWYLRSDEQGYLQGWYNDVAAWDAKLNWVREQKLGGIAIWVLDGENDPPQRWEVLEKFMHPRTPGESGR